MSLRNRGVYYVVQRPGLPMIVMAAKSLWPRRIACFELEVEYWHDKGWDKRKLVMGPFGDRYKAGEELARRKVLPITKTEKKHRAVIERAIGVGDCPPSWRDW